jgi:uncharacterized RDD family membrane protein YckC
MNRSLRWLAAAAMLAALGAALGAALSTTVAAAAQVHISIDQFETPSIRVLQDYSLRAGDTARQVVVIGGDAKIEGRVTQDVVVVLGRAELASTAVVEGSFVSVAGTVEIAEGAKVEHDFVVVGDANTPASFSPGGQHVVIGTAGFGERLRSMVPWLVHGLLLGRPIVPWLGWVWLVAGICFFINLCLNLIFDGPVRSCATTLRATPFSSVIAGLLVLLLAGPVCVLLAVSVIGIAVIPFFLCALVAAAVLGRIGFARWIGMSLVRQEQLEDRGESLRSFLIGSALMCVVYMIPFVGLALWIMAGVFGLGSATLAFYSSYRRENPRPPKKVVVPPEPSAVDAPGGTGIQGGIPAPVHPAMSAEPGMSTEPGMSAEPVMSAEPAMSAAAELPADFSVGSAGKPQGSGYRTMELVTFPKATFNERLAALALDLIVVGIAVQLLGFDRDGGPGERLAVLFALAYHVSFWTLRGTTLGGIICQLRVVRTDGRRLDFPDALIRGLTGIFSLAVVGLGFLWILRDPERQAWHDRVAGTYVVKVPRNYPI